MCLERETKRVLKPTFPVRSYRKLSDEQVMRGKFG